MKGAIDMAGESLLDEISRVVAEESDDAPELADGDQVRGSSAGQLSKVL